MFTLETNRLDWLAQQAKTLQEGNLAAIDAQGISHYLEQQIVNEEAAIASYLKRVMQHLLYLQYWESELEYNEKPWLDELDHFRSELRSLVESSNAYRRAESMMSQAYTEARKLAERKITRHLRKGCPMPELPLQCPYSLEELLKDED